MARMSLQRLNELMDKVLRDLGDERAAAELAGWFERHAQEYPPFVPLSNEDYLKRKRREEDDMLMNASVEELIGGGPKLWNGDPKSAWGNRSIPAAPWNTKRPTEGPVAPAYNWECYQCGRPITDKGEDHSGRTVCDLLLVDPIDVKTESYWTDHSPKPWNGEEEDDDEAED